MYENNILKIRLKTLRNEFKLTQEDVARKVGLTKSAYGYYEQGKTIPDAQMIAKLSEIFNVTTDYLLGISNIKNNNANNSYGSQTDERISNIINKIKNMDEKSKEKALKMLDLLLEEDD
ncbi:helix-turn-helix domain-containing protein [Metaclostridioides mangenotii]|uniref:helix-turn-helix domain-containing protein n=1 Tax=Metaclostridioides mangenotii TaxID=1540 RepID=UPI0026EBCFFE|nr:helix-turn-helix transcriptional regulator [Clostridioides mangenotii]